MSFNKKAWRYVTVFVVLIIILNPEMAELSLFIDVVGIDLFLMLLEVQLIAIFGVFIHSKIKPLYLHIKYFFNFLSINSWINIKVYRKSILLPVPSPDIVMNMLVISVLLGAIFNVH